MQQESFKRGFGSVEILLVVILILVLVGILVYSTGYFQKGSRDRKRQQFMKELMVALEDYKDERDHYPVAGDAIPGGAVVSGNNNINSVIALLDQSKLIDANKLVDPGYGPLFREFNGVDKMFDGVRFGSKIDICDGEVVVAQSDTLGTVSYSYFTPDGETYIMCLQNESGQVTTYVSPPAD